MEADLVDEKEINRRRWWTETFRVVEIDGTLIGYEYATTTGDESAAEKGWEFDPLTICKVVAREVTMTVYDPV